MRNSIRDTFTIGGHSFRPGERRMIEIPVASLYDATELSISVEVIHGKKPGPKLFISGAIHGDEINGTEIIKQVLRKKVLSDLAGTLLLIPVVNVIGFNTQSRYFPDRRDLNRVFPGRKDGSLASQFAYVFMREIVSRSTHGIDLHSAALHRTNLPQIRASLEDRRTSELAKCFGVPVIVNSDIRDGSLREAARKKNVTMLLYEGGEALRYNDDVIKTGVRGCLKIMKKIGMIDGKLLAESTRSKETYIAQGSYWQRAPHGGSFRLRKRIGDHVHVGDLLAIITDPFGRQPFDVRADSEGIIIGMSTLPLVHKGDAMFHIAIFKDSQSVQRAIHDFSEV